MREEQGQKCQIRAVRATTGQGNARAVLLCTGKEWPKQDMTNKAGEIKSQGRIKPDLGVSEQGGGQSRSRPAQTKSMAWKRNERAWEAVTGEAKPGSDMAG